MLQGKQRQPRISQQAVHATCVLLALTLAVYSALKVHLILDTRNHHSQSFSLRQTLPRHLGVEPEADLRPHAADLPEPSGLDAQLNRTQPMTVHTTAEGLTAGGRFNPLQPSKAKCYAMKSSNLWGVGLVEGSSHHAISLMECCGACLRHNQAIGQDACNVWSWCGVQGLCGSRYQECWLGHKDTASNDRPALVDDLHPGWTSGYASAGVDTAQQENSTTAGPGRWNVRKYHILSSSPPNPYGRWQIRLHYYWYLKTKAECERQLGDACEMGGYTRIVDMGEPDDLMQEIPTFLAKPLSKKVVDYTGYELLNRAYGLLQWAQSVDIEEDYVVIEESDHVYLRPVPNLMLGQNMAGAYYGYMQPTEDKHLPVVAEFMPSKLLTKEQAKHIGKSGSSPVFLTKEQVLKVTPAWLDVMIKMVTMPIVKEKWGWVREMWGFIIGVYLAGEEMEVLPYLLAHTPYASSPTHESGMPYYLLHYTHGLNYLENGTSVPDHKGDWRFNKRDYMVKPPPRHLPEPPAAVKNDLVRTLIRSINEATSNIPCWDEYAATARRSATCDEEIPGSIYPRPTSKAQSISSKAR